VIRAVALAAAILMLSGCSLLGDAPADDDVFSIVVGDCLDDADVPDEVTSLRTVDCAEPHDSEVFARTEASGSTFPGGDVLQDELGAFCRDDAFTEFVGIPFAESRYGTRGYFPTAESWANGDRELLCTIVDESGAQLTGSLAGVEE
jgi:hypothetical protein